MEDVHPRPRPLPLPSSSASSSSSLSFSFSSVPLSPPHPLALRPFSSPLILVGLRPSRASFLPRLTTCCIALDEEEEAEEEEGEEGKKGKGRERKNSATFHGYLI